MIMVKLTKLEEQRARFAGNVPLSVLPSRCRVYNTHER